MTTSRSLTRSEVRSLDQKAIQRYHVPGIVLMENASANAVQILLSLSVEGPVAILCGPGNNGGDGLAMARHLDNAGVSVRVISGCEITKWRGDAEVNYRIAAASGISIEQFRSAEQLQLATEGCDWVVDALLGNGSQGDPRSPYSEMIHVANDAEARRFAVDLPSGLDCDSGRRGDPTFVAHHTVTFVATKPGLLVPEARSVVGQLHVVGIGAPRVLLKQYGQIAE